MSAAIVIRAVVPAPRLRLTARLVPAGLALAVLAAYLRTMGRTVGSGDPFEFQVVAATLGIAHPTGYPLFILIGKLFSLIPIGQVAWRVNLVSVVFATSTVVLVYLLLARLLGDRVAALMAALALAFSHAMWSESTQADVITLDAAFVALLAIALCSGLDGSLSPGRQRSWLIRLAVLYGLSLTNHLTMVLWAPAILLTLWFVRPRVGLQGWLLAVPAFGLGLLPDLYTLLRWPAIHSGQWPAPAAFMAYLTGQQFRGAVQLARWHEAVRWEIMGGLMLQAFGVAGVALAAGGLAWLAFRRPRLAMLTFLGWSAYFAYGLVYNVPDVETFILPAHLLMAVWIGTGAAAAVRWLAARWGRIAGWARPLSWVAMAALPLGLLWTNAPLVDASRAGRDLYAWGRYVLALPIPRGAAILADSEKIAPLYYLQRVEGERPDLDIAVLGDEDRYRAELDRRVAAGQPVFLARYLPGLAGAYHLASLGPLVQASREPLTAPSTPFKEISEATWGNDSIALLGYDVERGSGGAAYRITLYWTAHQPIQASYHVRLRWVGPNGQVWWQDSGMYPVAGSYPTTAWQPGELVSDYHEIPADPTIPPGRLRLDVGLFLPFQETGPGLDGASSGGNSWYTLGDFEQDTTEAEVNLPLRLRASFGGELLLAAASDPGTLPPGEAADLIFQWQRIQTGPACSGSACGNYRLRLSWTDAAGAEAGAQELDPYGPDYPTSAWPVGRDLWVRARFPAPSQPGRYQLRVGWLDGQGRTLPARCGWPARPGADCPAGTLQVTEQVRSKGVNFADQVLLLDARLDCTQLRRGTLVRVELRWQGLRRWDANYTAFVHLVGPDGKVHGQLDQWPLDGALATSGWSPGRTVDDPYTIRVPDDAPLGTYQVEVGWYLLATLRRLPVLDPSGRPVDDRVIIGSLTVQ